MEFNADIYQTILIEAVSLTHNFQPQELKKQKPIRAWVEAVNFGAGNPSPIGGVGDDRLFIMDIATLHISLC